MEQRSLRLGDLVDDYCPRERRVTNHVIVVLAGDVIRQTRCNTCDAEHEYKEAKVPRKKLKGDANLAGGVLVPKGGSGNGAAADDPPVPAAAAAPASSPDPEPTAPDSPQEPESNGADSDSNTMPDGWISHRPLIRATLPKTEGDAPPPRAIPEFTMHQRQGRGFGGRGGFRHGFAGHNGGRMPPNRDGSGGGNEPDGNRSPAPGGGKSRHRRRRRR